MRQANQERKEGVYAQRSQPRRETHTLQYIDIIQLQPSQAVRDAFEDVFPAEPSLIDVSAALGRVLGFGRVPDGEENLGSRC